MQLCCCDKTTRTCNLFGMVVLTRQERATCLGWCQERGGSNPRVHHTALARLFHALAHSIQSLKDATYPHAFFATGPMHTTDKSHPDLKSGLRCCVASGSRVGQGKRAERLVLVLSFMTGSSMLQEITLAPFDNRSDSIRWHALRGMLLLQTCFGRAFFERGLGEMNAQNVGCRLVIQSSTALRSTLQGGHFSELLVRQDR